MRVLESYYIIAQCTRFSTLIEDYFYVVSHIFYGKSITRII